MLLSLAGVGQNLIPEVRPSNAGAEEDAVMTVALLYVNKVNGDWLLPEVHPTVLPTVPAVEEQR